MPGLILSSDVANVNLDSKHLEITRREKDDASISRRRIPLHDVDRVVICGRPCVSIAVLQRFMTMGIPCFFVSSHGRWIGSLLPDRNLQAERRVRQYECAHDDRLALRVSRKLICAKLRNSRRVLQRLAANRKESQEQEQTNVEADLLGMIHQAERAESTEELRGYEGLGAAWYFGRLGRFFPEKVPFCKRSRRPPKDAANALLSWTYTILLGEIEGTVRSHGLDSGMGFLHELEHGRPALSVDLLEPLRAPVCDLLALNLLNHKVLTEESFECDLEEEGWRLKKSCHRDFFFAYEQAMNRKFTPKKGDPHTDFRRVIDDQVCAVIRALEGESDFDFFQMP